MNREVRTEIAIAAPAEKVWSVLTDFARFPDWNPFVTAVEGDPREGARLRIDVRLPGARKLKFTPEVMRATPLRELRWVGQLPLGAFRGEHFYLIEDGPDGQTRFVHGELFSGWLVRVIWLIHGERIEAGYRLMNEALKREAEKV
jgi:hypothetical protein